MRLSVFGMGYVGSVTASCLARSGHDVVGVDINPDKVALVNKGIPPVVEPGLDIVLAEALRAGHLRATTSPDEAIRASEVGLICVGTPGMANGQLDRRTVERVAFEIGRALRNRAEPFTVVLRSTVLPGVTEGVLLPALRAGGDGAAQPPLRVAVNPEFLREGSALQDFRHPPFTLVGSDDPAALSVVRSVYHDVQAPFVGTTIRTAEMVKYTTNAFHALKVCFANEIGDICTALGADPQEVMRIFLMDRKLNLSEAYLRPGFAFGGSCLPKDLRALLYAARSADVWAPLLSAILPSNEAQTRHAVEAVLATRKRRIGVLGLAFKPGTDDLRNSPMVTLVEALIGKGCDVRIFDRHVSIARLIGANRQYIEEEIPHVASLMCDSLDALLAHAEVLVIANAGEDCVNALGAARPDHVLIDLTRNAIRENMRFSGAADCTE